MNEVKRASRVIVVRPFGYLMTIRLVRNLTMLCTLSGFTIGLSAAQNKQVKKTVLTPGAQLYKQNCAVCHGNDGKGNGPPPANSPFTESPPDLTTLAQRHKGEFPEAYVADVLRNGVKMPDHGPAEMPIWGIMLKETGRSDETQVKVRISNLIDYLRSIQTAQAK